MLPYIYSAFYSQVNRFVILAKSAVYMPLAHPWHPVPEIRTMVAIFPDSAQKYETLFNIKFHSISALAVIHDYVASPTFAANAN
jgi:hypothetical protein